MTDIKKPQRGVHSIDVGGRILKDLATDGGSMKLRDLSDVTGIAPGQLHPYLVSFRNMGMVEKTQEGLYRLGPFALQLGLTKLRRQNPHRKAISRISALSDQLQLMISVAVWVPQGPTITYIQEQPRSLHINIRVGGVYSLVMTATGQVFTAYLPDAETAPLVADEFADNDSQRRSLFTIDEKAFKSSVKLARKQGFAATCDMPIPGITAISAPVFDYTGKIQLCIAAIGPSAVIETDLKSPVVQTMLDFTNTLSHDLGYLP